jgi:excisionase family DNA binding protein
MLLVVKTRPRTVRGRTDTEDDVMLAASPHLLTIVDAAQHLGISRSKVYELLAAGELPSVRIGRTRRIAVTALEEFIAAHTDHGDVRSSA